jgi:hypothetical protein
MRVNSGVIQVPPLKTHEPRHHEATSRSPADGGRNRSRGEQPQNPNCSRVLAGGPSQGSNSAGSAGGSAAALVAARAVVAGAHHTVLAGELVTAVIAEAEATRTATSPASHTEATMLTIELMRFIAKSLLKQVIATASLPSLLDFATYFSLRNSSLSGSPSTTRSKTQFSGLGAMPYPLITLVATTTRSTSTSPSAWTRHHSLGSSRSTRTRLTSGTNSRLSSPATSRVPWGARVLAWT